MKKSKWTFFPSLRLCLVVGNFEGKCKGKKIKSEKKKGFKVNKLFLNITLNLFHLFSYIILRLNNFKMYKFLINFNYI